MTPGQRKALQRLETVLQEAQALVRELLQDRDHEHGREGVRSQFDAVKFLASLRDSDRTGVAERLSSLKQHELGAVFVEARGSVSDRKKPKVWLIDQILWRLFDFDRGHEAIRRGESEGRS
jgi:hypothetical protein